MSYVDGFLIPIKKKNLNDYIKLAKAAGKIWREHGALQYFECVGDDVKVKGLTSFNTSAKTKAGEVVIFSFIIYKSKADRNKVNAKVMKDPRMNKMMDGKPMPFEMKRMAYGGFKVSVEA